MSIQAHFKKKLSHFTLDIQLDFHEGISALLGYSGCGKSMTLKCIAGIEKPDEGYIIVNDRVLFDSKKGINLPAQQRRVGYLFQNYALFPNMSVKENILVSLRKNEHAPKEQILQSMLELFNLEGHEDKYPDELSGGQQQRVALARILVSKPDILLLDEPFAALDTFLREKLQMEMKELLMDYHHDVIMVTHDRNEAYRMADHIGILDQGKVLIYKETDELFHDPEIGLAAQLTGCKNIEPIQINDDHSFTIIPWNLQVNVEREIPKDATHMGIRAHYFKSCKDPAFQVQYVGEMQDAFEKIVKFRYASQNTNSEDIWWKIPNENIPESLPECLEFKEDAILFLKGGEL